MKTFINHLIGTLAVSAFILVLGQVVIYFVFGEMVSYRIIIGMLIAVAVVLAMVHFFIYINTNDE